MKDKAKDDFIPFGPEWEKYMLTLPKKFLIQQLKSALMNSKDLNPIELISKP